MRRLTTYTMLAFFLGAFIFGLNAFAGRIARESNCKKLVLTHFYPICGDYDISGQCKEEFNGEVVLAEDLMTIEV